MAITLCFLPSCYSPVPEEKPSPGGHLTIGHYYPIDIINPIISNSGTSGFLIHIVFNGLAKPDENFNMVPDLAYKWESSKDGLKWKFYLREGVKFHDGTEMTAEDVKFTYDLIKSSEYRGYYTQFFGPVEQVNIIDKYAIEIVLREPYSPLLSGLAVGIIPKHIYSGRDLKDPEVNKQPIGTGPFKVVKYSSSEALLAANRDHFDGQPYLEKVSFRIFQDQKALFAKMMDETIDVIYYTNPENIDILKQVPYFKQYKFLRPFYYILAFQNKGIFKDRRVRIALNYAVNKKKLVENVLKNDGKIAFGTIYPESWAFNKEINPYPYNPRKALKLLNEAGWKDTNGNNILDKEGLELDFTVLFKEGFAVDEKSLKHIKVDINQIGVSLKAKKFSAKEFNTFIMKKEFDAIIIDLAGRGDPDNSYKF
ncbi:MAG: ABC transporter substrate-binding protein, partial [Nitrospinota bacterium]|nr:ABC transporter substrate-binding protein [Nitrospinota bacterium]